MFTRRDVIVGCAAITTASGMTKFVSAGAAVTRPNIDTPRGKEMLTKYRTAASAMKDMSAFPHHDPRAWNFQANIHWVHPEDANDEAIAKIFSVDGASPSEAARIRAHMQLALGAQSARAWQTCQHEDRVEFFFLAWHRLYLWHFEQIVSGVLGDAFALPYWDYTQPANRKIPAEFREQVDGSLQKNGLWYEHRRADLNDEADPGELEAGDVDARLAFRSQGLYLPNEVSGFNRLLNNSPHGLVHSALGAESGDPGMGSVPTAGRDPIFWVHHCNIDRMWEIWRRTERGRDDEAKFRDQWEGVSFVFADRNGDRVEVAAISALDLPALGYDYDNVPTPDETLTVFSIGADQRQILASRQENEEVVVRGSGAEFTLAPSPVPFIQTEMTSTRASLELEIVASQEPRTSFDVFVAVSAESGASAEEKLLGRFSLFGASTRRDAGQPGFTIVLDASGCLPQLKSYGNDNVRVRIAAAYGKTEVPFTVQSARLVTED